ncbi:C-type lectin domain family 10 member A [Pygocentrus nattereri]|uniref:C-type lectin domain-containing protein n=1 Tax=Pygocentrus nattereri TaxID=42514 RepID=A0A3B4D201_PYGNA|nr:C-type lectin domain family 10 member A [Pygocentrus nattereri]
MMKDSTAADSATSNDYHDDFDNTDTRAFWRKEAVSRFTAVRPGGQSRWSFCVLGVSAVVLLILIISISVTKVQVDRKLSAVERDISNLTQNLLSITSRIQQLDKNGEAVQQKLSEMLQNLNVLQVQAQDMSADVQSNREFASQLKCVFNKFKNNDTQDHCCPLDWTPFSSHCYYFSDYGMSWHQAQDKCESMKAELLILKSKEEKEFVVQRTKPHYYWLGLSDERTGQWEWLDGTPFAIVRSEWMPGQPDDWTAHGLGGGEDCAHFHRDGRYNDDHCSRDYRFVCKAHSLTIQ